MNNKNFEKIGVNINSVLLPNKQVDLQKWSVVACDQYTSEPEYWNNVENLIDSSPSTYNIIFPEVFLESESDEQKRQRIKNINSTMESYVKNDFLLNITNSIILTERTIENKKRKGFILSVDLECYDYSKGSQSLIRATEGTIIDRLPPRIKVRENASLELPHIMLLIDDSNETVIEPLFENLDSYNKVYDFDLMMDGGHLRGFQINDQEVLNNISNSLVELSSSQVFNNKYNVDDKYGILLFAVGDGNHSLATAKACWENIKKTLTKEQLENHPARYALVEVVNVHDKGLEFEPIHRVLFNIDKDNFIEDIKKYFANSGKTVTFKEHKSFDESISDVNTTQKNTHKFAFVCNEFAGTFYIENPDSNLAVGTLQEFLDNYLVQNKQVRIDYIHGEDVVETLGSKKGNAGFYLPAMDKNDLFKTVVLDGALPRKTFSMGEANEKRFYLECRKIK